MTYEALAYAGPKDRDRLAAIDHGAPEVLNLGTFSFIARGLVWYLYRLHSVTRSWGWAIVLLTITVRTVLFPLSLSQIKTSMAMRKLKPEMDLINAKYKDDAAQRGVAIQELWRKNNVSNPVLGCLPMLGQMPVWWALYTALQTAVEFYHVPFGPVIVDLTSPGKILHHPDRSRGVELLQQKLMPAQGDPQQQKMMLYMMPAIFTFMMLFLPAGLGVYMLTNSVLAIGQQLLVERYLKDASLRSRPDHGEREDFGRRRQALACSWKGKGTCPWITEPPRAWGHRRARFVPCRLRRARQASAGLRRARQASAGLRRARQAGALDTRAGRRRARQASR